LVKFSLWILAFLEAVERVALFQRTSLAFGLLLQTPTSPALAPFSRIGLSGNPPDKPQNTLPLHISLLIATLHGHGQPQALVSVEPPVLGGALRPLSAPRRPECTCPSTVSPPPDPVLHSAPATRLALTGFPIQSNTTRFASLSPTGLFLALQSLLSAEGLI
jgi:hypothetical protein